MTDDGARVPDTMINATAMRSILKIRHGSVRRRATTAPFPEDRRS